LTVEAYILIQTDVGRASEVATDIRRLPGVASADTVAGPYDVIARAEVETIDELGHFVVSRVQPIDGVTRTLTSPIIAL
jgi:DNA-binding Lrp family transcriptional regulator